MAFRPCDNVPLHYQRAFCIHMLLASDSQTMNDQQVVAGRCVEHWNCCPQSRSPLQCSVETVVYCRKRNKKEGRKMLVWTRQTVAMLTELTMDSFQN